MKKNRKVCYKWKTVQREGKDQEYMETNITGFYINNIVQRKKRTYIGKRSMFQKHCRKIDRLFIGKKHT